MSRLRRKMLLQAAIACTCLLEAVGCPQMLGNAIKDGTRSFLESGFSVAFLSALNFDALLTF